MLPIESFWTFVTGVIAYGGGASVIAYFIFQLLGKTWIESKFSKQLEVFRHEQALEIQKLRVEIESLLSGRLKLQDRDFQILPEAWAKLNQAHRALNSALISYREYPDLNRYQKDDLDEFVASLDISETGKKRISNSSKPLDVYREITDRKQINDVRRAIYDFKLYVDTHSILLSIELKDRFDNIATEMWSAIISKEVGREVNDWNIQQEGFEKLEKKVGPAVKEIEGLIHAALSSHSKSNDKA